MTIIVKHVLRDPKTNSVEAQWVDRKGYDEDGIPMDTSIKCRSYHESQMAELEADLGADAPAHASLIATVRAAIRQPTPTEIEAARVAAVPKSASPRQIRQALTRAGLRAGVEAAVAAGDQDIKDWWEFATEFQRGNTHVAAMATALGVTSRQLDDLWTLAASL